MSEPFDPPPPPKDPRATHDDDRERAPAASAEPAPSSGQSIPTGGSGGGYPPPPPTGTGPGGMPPEAARRLVEPAAIALVVVAALGILASLWGLFNGIVGGAANFADFADLSELDPQARRFVEGLSAGGGALGLLWPLFGLGVYGFILWAGLEMRQLRRWNVALVASILVMLPCSCCCLFGIPVGIWALVILLKPEVKAAFTS